MTPFFEIFTGSLLGCLLGYIITSIGSKGTERWFRWDSGDEDESREFRKYSDMLEYLDIYGWRTLHYNETSYQSYKKLGGVQISSLIPINRIIREHFCQQTPTDKLLAWIWRAWKYATDWLRNESIEWIRQTYRDSVEWLRNEKN